ncbi:MAG: ACT domain-containing protein [Puniceicoccaceae bacterium]
MLLSLLPQQLAVVRLEPKSEIPAWALQGSFYSITHTPDELSIFCDSQSVPEDLEKSEGWRAFRVAGQLDLDLTGVISQLAMPLAAKQIPIFSISTHDTDYMLVQEFQLEDALDVLRRAGHDIHLPEHD